MTDNQRVAIAFALSFLEDKANTAFRQEQAAVIRAMLANPPARDGEAAPLTREAASYAEFGTARERFINKTPVQCSDEVRKLAQQVIDQGPDTRTDEEIARAGAAFICDTRLDLPVQMVTTNPTATEAAISDAEIEQIANRCGYRESDNITLYAFSRAIFAKARPAATDYCAQHCQTMCQNSVHGVCDGAPEQAPVANSCATCNGHGMIGGPSFREPDEGGVPCPDCTPAAGETEDASLVAMCCGRRECGGECGNEWRGMCSAHSESIPDPDNSSAASPTTREAERIINRLMSSDPQFDDCSDAADLIRKLIEELRATTAELLAAPASAQPPVVALSDFGTCPHLPGCSGLEPSLREIIVYYYLQAFNRDESAMMADKYINALLAKQPPVAALTDKQIDAAIVAWFDDYGFQNDFRRRMRNAIAKAKD